MSTEAAGETEPAKLPGSLPARLFLLAVSLVSLAYALDLYRLVGLTLYSQQYLAIVLGVGLPGTFLAVRARKTAPVDRIPWYDAAAAVVSGAVCVWILIVYPTLLDRLHETPVDAVVAGGLLLVLVVEGLRRTVGLTLVIVVLCFIGVGLAAHLLPGELQGREVPWDQLAVYLGLDPNGILGLPLMICATVIVMFIIFGEMLAASGGTHFFTDLAAGTMGRYRGGALKMAVVASSLFGSVSGSAVSNVVSTGVVTIPLMRKSGLAPEQAGAVEAVASTGGQLMPPIMGASAFLMAELLQIPYGDIVLAALIPACLYYVALFFVIDLQAGRLGITRVDQSTLPRVAAIFRSGWHYILPFAIIVAALFWWNRPPETAAAFGLISLLALWLLFSGYSGRLKPARVLATLTSAGYSALGMLMIGAAAGIIIGTLNVSAVGFSLTLALVNIAEGSLIALLLMAAVVCIILGMGMPTVGVYILLAALIAPSLIEMGVQPLTAHLFVLYYGMMSMITPPVAIAAFAGANLAGAPPMRTALSAIKFGWTAYIVPFLFVFEPALTMEGSVGSILVTVGLVAAGIWSMSVALVGYLGGPLEPISRLGFVLLGLILILPTATAPWLNWAQLVALAALAGYAGTLLVLRRRAGPAGAPGTSTENRSA